MYNFRIYLFKDRGYVLDKVTEDELEIDNYIKRKDKDYSRLLVIKHDISKNMDIPYVLKYFDSVILNKKPKRKSRRRY